MKSGAHRPRDRRAGACGSSRCCSRVDVGRWRSQIAAGDRTDGGASGRRHSLDPADAPSVRSGAVARRSGRRHRATRGDPRLRDRPSTPGRGFDNGAEQSLRREIAESALEGVVLTGSPLQVARADVLLGVLAFSTASAPPGVTTPGERSVDAFTEAARLDPSDTAAKFDLEVVLRALTPTGTRPGSNPSAGRRRAWRPRRGRRASGVRVLMLGSLTFLTPSAGLLALLALIPLAALVVAGRHVRRARAVLRLGAPTGGGARWRPIAVLSVPLLVALALAQPVLRRHGTVSTRADAGVFVVVDTSSSMAAASSAHAPSRLAQARRIARAVGSQLPGIPLGVATFTDRVLPDLFPTVDAAVFNSTIETLSDRESSATGDVARRNQLLGARRAPERGLLLAPPAAPRAPADHRRGERRLRFRCRRALARRIARRARRGRTRRWRRRSAVCGGRTPGWRLPRRSRGSTPRRLAARLRHRRPSVHGEWRRGCRCPAR